MPVETKDKILDTAERLFAEQGYDGTSLRSIIARADVNLAAVHYHFHSKDSLLDAVVLRKMKTVNESRIAMLDQAETEAGDGPLPVERVLEALMAPTFAMALGHPLFAKLMGRLQSEGVLMRLMTQHFQPVIARFVGAFQRALPHLDREDLLWRLHFAVGAMAHALRSRPELGASGEINLPAEEISRRLVTFLAAGMRLPAQET